MKKLTVAAVLAGMVASAGAEVPLADSPRWTIARGDAAMWAIDAYFGAELHGYRTYRGDRALGHLRDYSRARLLGEHVPYPVEAWPEGNRRHLSSEGALYCRLFTEGVFGLRPTGFDAFEVRPHLPKGWTGMALRNVHAFNQVFDLEVDASGRPKAVPRISQANTKGKP